MGLRRTAGRMVRSHKWRELNFRLNPVRRRYLFERYRHCQGPHDYIELARMAFTVNQKTEETLGLLELAEKLHPRCLLEIGTAGAGNTFILGQALPTVTLVIGVDLHINNGYQLSKLRRPGQQIELIEGSSHSPQTKERILLILGDRKLDLVFIDGDHSYDGVRQDFIDYGKFVRTGGIVALHDIVPDFGTRYGRPTLNWTGEVPRFWQEIDEGLGRWEFVEDPQQDGYGIGVVQR